MKNEFLYFDYFEGKLSQALQEYYNVFYSFPQPIVIKYSSAIYGLKEYRHLLDQLIEKDILKMHPQIRKTVRNYILGYREDIKLLYLL